MPYYRYSRFRSPRRRGFFDIRRRMRSVDWSEYSLAKFDKKFYQERSSVRDRSRRDIEEFRSKNKVTVLGHNVVRPLFKFSEAGFPSDIMDMIKKNNWEKPTPVQSQCWPVVLSGRDLVGITQAGSGRIVASVLPAIVHAKAQPSLKRGEGPIIIILVPSKEVAHQVEKVAEEFCSCAGFRCVAIYGGSSRSAQNEKLERSPEIVIATPGRLLDFLDGRNTNLKRCSYLVLHEADHMLDMGFEPSIRKVASQVRPDRQTLMWSATWPREVKALAEDFLYDYIQINVGSAKLDVSSNVRQYVEVMDEGDKLKRLVNLLKTFSLPRAVIFTETKRRTDEVCDKLRDKGFEASSLHCDKHQRDRERVFDSFRSGRTSVIVTTDVPSRGFDIEDLRCVINYDYPNQTEEYVNRINVAGKSDKKGAAYTFFTSKQSRMAADLINILNESTQKVPEELVQLSEERAAGKISPIRSWRPDRSVSSHSRSPVKRSVSRRHRSSSTNSRRSVSSYSRSMSRDRSRSFSPKKSHGRPKSKSLSRNGRKECERSKSNSRKRGRSSHSRSPSHKPGRSRSTSQDSRRVTYHTNRTTTHRSSSERSSRDGSHSRSQCKRRQTRTNQKSNGESIRSRSSSLRSASANRSRSNTSGSHVARSPGSPGSRHSAIGVVRSMSHSRSGSSELSQRVKQDMDDSDDNQQVTNVRMDSDHSRDSSDGRDASDNSVGNYSKRKVMKDRSDDSLDSCHGHSNPHSDSRNAKSPVSRKGGHKAPDSRKRIDYSTRERDGYHDNRSSRSNDQSLKRRRDSRSRSVSRKRKTRREDSSGKSNRHSRSRSDSRRRSYTRSRSRDERSPKRRG